MILREISIVLVLSLVVFSALIGWSSAIIVHPNHSDSEEVTKESKHEKHVI